MIWDATIKGDKNRFKKKKRKKRSLKKKKNSSFVAPSTSFYFLLYVSSSSGGGGGGGHDGGRFLFAPEMDRREEGGRDKHIKKLSNDSRHKRNVSFTRTWIIPSKKKQEET